MKNQDDPQPLPDRAELEKTVESLKRDIHKLQLEHDLLKMAAELKKRPGHQPRSSEQSGEDTDG